MARVFIGFGSNIRPAENVRTALRLLAGQVRIAAISTVYRTAAEGQPAQAPYYNGVVEIETELSPHALKYDVLRRIEDRLGRVRSEDKYAPRPIDLDVLLYDNQVMPGGDPPVPDPTIARRAFIALPLCELAPALVLPDTGQRIAEIARALADQPMMPLTEYTAMLRKDIIDEQAESTGADS